jgi:protein-tyrosine phosphatase
MADDTRLDIMFFCLGNICRSPLAEALFRERVESRGLEDRFHIESSGTSSYHIGEAPDPGSQRVARQRLNRDISHQRAQQLTDSHVQDFDYLFAMDRSNRRRALKLDGADEDRIQLIRDFDESASGEDVPDPYGGGESQFDLVYDILERSTQRLLDDLLERHPELR